jgi:uncharacterized protein YodC (DUF2158 family)
LQPGVYTTELRWENISKSATGFYECRYNDSARRNVAVQFYHMIVQEAQAPRLKFKQFGKKKKNFVIEIKEGKDASLECQLEEGAPTPIVSWFKVKHEFVLIKFEFLNFFVDFFQNDVLLDKLTPENGLTFNEVKINGTFRSYLHFERAELKNEGEYTCHFENRLGYDNQTFRLDIDVNGDFYGATIAIIVVLILIVLLLILVARIFYVRFAVLQKFVSLHTSNPRRYSYF